MELDVSYLKATLLPIWQYIEDDFINEIKISHYQDDLGAVWIYKHGKWEMLIDKYGKPILLANKKINQIIGFMAGSNDKFAHAKNPIVETSVPVLGFRFTGVMIPASIGCSKFNIRKFSTRLYTFEDYVEQGMFEEEYIDVLRNWVRREHFTICVAGSTNSGKTTFLCSLINEKRTFMQNANWVVIEDTKELTINPGNVDRLITTNEINMDDLLKVTLRLTPDNCVVGEVRGKEASTTLELAKIKSVMFTMHAGKSYLQALSRFERMILQHPDVDKLDRQDVADNINCIISIQNIKYKRQDERGNVINGIKRVINNINEITGYDTQHNMYQHTVIK
jgi:Flp pilus assembly CpaF family ATPase